MIRRKLAIGTLVAVCGVVVAFLTAGAQASAPSPEAVRSGAPHFAVAPQGAAPLVSTASVIYSNLVGGQYYPLNGWCINGTSGACGPYQAIAMPFTPTAGNRVSQIDVALQNLSGTNNATVQLAADDGTGLPGPVLGSWSVANQPPFSSCCGLTTVAVSPTIGVGAGRTYWVVVYPGPNALNNTEDVWNWTYYGYVGPGAFNQGGGWIGFDSYESAFDVLGCGKLCKV